MKKRLLEIHLKDNAPKAPYIHWVSIGSGPKQNLWSPEPSGGNVLGHDIALLCFGIKVHASYQTKIA